MEENVLLEMAAIKEQGNVLHDMINARVNAVKEKVEGIIKDSKQSNKVNKLYEGYSCFNCGLSVKEKKTQI